MERITEKRPKRYFLSTFCFKNILSYSSLQGAIAPSPPPGPPWALFVPNSQPVSIESLGQLPVFILVPNNRLPTQSYIYVCISFSLHDIEDSEKYFAYSSFLDRFLGEKPCFKKIFLYYSSRNVHVILIPLSISLISIFTSVLI